MVRQNRSKAPAINAAGITSASMFKNTLSTERRMKFPFENQRWFDLLRFNTTITTITAQRIKKAHFAKEYPGHYKDYPAPALTLEELQANVTKEKLSLPISQR